MAQINDIITAVTAELNRTEFALAFTAESAFLPVFELKDMATLRVTVIPRNQSFHRLSRETIGRDIEIDIGVQKRLAEGSDEIVTLLELIEEIADHFDGKRLSGYEKALCTRVVNEPVYAPEHLSQYRQFTSVLTLTFKVMG